MAQRCRQAVLLAASAVTLGACIFNPGDTCNDDVCIPNAPPVAVISDVGSDGALRVGSFTQVLVSAGDSYDPEGTAITFAWSVSAACEGNVVGGVTNADLVLDNLTFGATCGVTVTVTDERNGTGSATANLLVRNVGGFVTSTQSCISLFNPDTAQAQGTPLAPFCKVDQALQAARTYHLTQVSLDLGTHTVVGGLLVDFPLTIRGHYASGSASWPQATSGTTTVVLQQNPDVPEDAGLGVIGGVLVTLADLGIRRGGACKTDCVLIGVADASMTFNNVLAGDPTVASNNPAANDAGGHIYVTLYATTANQGLRAGAPGTGGTVGGTVNDTTPVTNIPSVAIGSINSTGLTIYGSRSAPVSMGIVIGAAYDTDLRGLEIHERAPKAVGVRTLAARDVKLSAGIVDVQSPGGLDTIAEGIVDGDRNTVSVANCAAPAVVCGSSRTLEVLGMSVSTGGGLQSVGVASLGSETVNVDGGSVTINGQQAWGLITTKSSDVHINNLTIDASAGRGEPTRKAFAVGYSDSFANDDGTVPDLGSAKITLTSSRVRAHVGDNTIDLAAGVNLVASSNATLSGNIISVDGTGYGTSTVSNAAAIRLAATSDTDISGGTARVTALSAAEAAAGIADGEPFRNGVTPIPPSKGLSISNVAVTTQVAFTSLGAVGAGILLADTNDVILQGTRGATALDCGFSNVATAYGVFLAATGTAMVRDLGILMHGASGAGFIAGTNLVGIHDGALDAVTPDLFHPSDDLVITGNRIRLTQPTAVQVGIRLRGTGSTKALIDDNVITGLGSIKNIGVLLHGAHATVAYNSFRTEGCAACSPSQHPFAVGVYLMHAEPLDSSYLGNVFSSVSTMDPLYRPAFVEHNHLISGTTFSIGTVTATLYGSEVDTFVAGFVAATANDATDIQAPDTMAAFSIAQVPGTGNAVASPKYCPDGIHGSIDGPQHGAATVVGQVMNRDIDGEQRSLTSIDAGADLIADICPP